MTGGRWAELVCFAGIGPGEVLLGGRKLVGISQRRTRNGSRFQCMVHTRWSPDVLVDLLAEPRPTVEELPGVAVVAPRSLTPCRARCALTLARLTSRR